MIHRLWLHSRGDRVDAPTDGARPITLRNTPALQRGQQHLGRKSSICKPTPLERTFKPPLVLQGTAVGTTALWSPQLPTRLYKNTRYSQEQETRQNARTKYPVLG